MLDNYKRPYFDFKQTYRENNLGQARKLALFGVFFYLLFAAIDLYIAPSAFNKLIIIRLIFTSLLTSIIFLTFLKPLEKHWQELFSILLLTAGIGILIMASYLPNPIKTLYSQGILLVTFYGYTMNRLLLMPATIAGISLFIIYTLTSYNSPEIHQTHLVTGLFFMFATNAFGIFNMIYKQRLLYKEYNLSKRNEKQSKEIVLMNKKLIQLNKKLHDLSLTDPLTGLPNRRHFDENLEKLVLKCKTEKKPLTLIMVDIDFFKSFNDYYGHIKGDQCLIQFAKILQDVVLKNGLCARFGGEEFTILLPNTGFNTAMNFAKNIQSSLKENRIQHQDSSISPFLTASFGVVTVCKEFQSLSGKKIVTYADTCLYKAKEKGRNKIIGQSL